MTKAFLILTITMLFFSCKKDKLIGERAKYIGKWKWIYNHERILDHGTPTGEYYNRTPASFGYEYDVFLELKESGRYNKYHDGKKVEDGRIIFGSANNYAIYFKNGLDDKEVTTEEDYISVIDNDTLVLWRYPVLIGGGENYFVRE